MHHVGMHMALIDQHGDLLLGIHLASEKIECTSDDGHGEKSATEDNEFGLDLHNVVAFYIIPDVYEFMDQRRKNIIRRRGYKKYSRQV